MSRPSKKYKVVNKITESEIITSFFLKPMDGSLPPVKPGQFLTFDLKINDDTVRRTYSVSGWDGETYRITIKREPAPHDQPELPAGLSSNYFHDNVDVGSVLEAYDPSGNFVLNDQSSRPVVLLSGGVGLTPLVAMANVLAKQGTRKTWFIHACENARVHALGNEMRELDERHENITTCFAYRQPDECDRIGVDYDYEGVICHELLKSLLPIDDYEFYLCGPPGFMQAVFDTLIKAGITEDHISYEFFGPATVLRPTVEQMPLASQTVQADQSRSADEDLALPTITFSDSGITATWDPELDSLLEFAEAQGLMPDFSCRSGVCSTCECKLVSGELDYTEPPLEEPDEGYALICCSKPKGDVTLKL